MNASQPDPPVASDEAHGRSPVAPDGEICETECLQSDRSEGVFAAGVGYGMGGLGPPFLFAAHVAAVRLDSHWPVHLLPGFPGAGERIAPLN